MKIEIKTVRHRDQRYPTQGDWFFDEDRVLQIRVSEMGDERSEIAVALHEITEAICCGIEGITEQEVTEFDLQFEKERDAGQHGEDEEPGHDTRAPYNEAHKRAESVERVFCAAVDLLWDDHDRKVKEAELNG